ncbi:OsmC family protein [Ramlibacter sp. AN1133]|uniref:OsmC family protein n=1 Tax=Ramlibacter sp. AN1133 TaxID=3133429 RepID=UPI0030BFF90C
MHPFPHRYHAQARAAGTGRVMVGAEGLPEIETDAPPEFGGPPGHWSPETLLVAAIADCFILSFRASARASRLAWLSLAVDVEGVLEKADGTTLFTRFTISPRLTVSPGTSETLAQSVLQHAKRLCLITNSLSGACELASTVHVVANDEAPAGP